MNEKSGYFEAALSNFMFDVASGGAIRHLAEKGHSVDQIMKELDFPTPRDRVEKTVYQYMIDSGMLLMKLPDTEENMKAEHFQKIRIKELHTILLHHIHFNGEENSYMLCPFGKMIKNDMEQFNMLISCLTEREKEYIKGIRWERNIMYHRLNSRMFEIGVQLAVNSEFNIKFYFFKEKKILCFNEQ